MNAFLADLYGTGQEVGTNNEIEKLAEAQVIDEQLRAENIDINALSGEDLLKCAYVLFGEDSAIVKSAGDEPEEAKHEAEESKKEEEEEEGKESLAEKIAEADFLGRVMAHSYHQESQAISKQAGVGEFVKSLPGRVKGKFEETQAGIGSKVYQRALNKGKSVPKATQSGHRAEKAFRYGVPAAGGAAVGGITYAALKKKKEEK
jgi:hypothetical protein